MSLATVLLRNLCQTQNPFTNKMPTMQPKARFSTIEPQQPASQYQTPTTATATATAPPKSQQYWEFANGGKTARSSDAVFSIPTFLPRHRHCHSRRAKRKMKNLLRTFRLQILKRKNRNRNRKQPQQNRPTSLSTRP